MPTQINPIASPNLVPSYAETKLFAYRVQAGYAARASLNGHAVHAGATAGVVGAGAVSGMALYGAGLSFVPVIGLLGTVLAGLGLVYQNDAKAELYSKAADVMAAVIAVSDHRIGAAGGVIGPMEAACLELATASVMNRVNSHVTALIPGNVQALLKVVADHPDPATILTVANQLGFKDLDVPLDPLGLLAGCDRKP